MGGEGNRGGVRGPRNQFFSVYKEEVIVVVNLSTDVPSRASEG